MSSGFDFKEFEQFKKNILKIDNDFDDFLKKFMLNQGLKWIAKTKPRTPVDTGALRASWELSDVRIYANNVEIDLINNQNYAAFVEYGTSKMEGRYMATISLDEIQKAMPEQFESQFKIYCKERGLGNGVYNS